MTRGTRRRICRMLVSTMVSVCSGRARILVTNQLPLIGRPRALIVWAWRVWTIWDLTGTRCSVVLKSLCDVALPSRITFNKVSRNRPLVDLESISTFYWKLKFMFKVNFQFKLKYKHAVKGRKTSHIPQFCYSWIDWETRLAALLLQYGGIAVAILFITGITWLKWKEDSRVTQWSSH